MLLNVDHEFGCAPVLKVSGDLATGKATQAICQQIATLRFAGYDAIALDLTDATSKGYTGAFTLIETVTREAKSKVAIFGAPKTLTSKLDSSGLARFLNIHADRASALRSVYDPRQSLVGTTAVILAAGNGTRMGPLSNVTPKPLLDVLGKPVLERLMDHLTKFGISNILLNPGHKADQIPAYFKAHPNGQYRVSYFPEGHWRGEDWHAPPIGNASTLRRLNREFHALSGDVIVMCGDALTNIDLAAMMSKHRASGAAATIAAKPVPAELVSRYGIIVANDAGRVTSFQEKPKPSEARSTLANTGIYIFKSDVLSLLPNQTELDIAQDLLPMLMDADHRISVYQADFEWRDLGTGKDYFEVLASLLQNDCPFDPVGIKRRDGLWVHKEASVSPKAHLSGPIYIGAGATIEQNATIKGPAIIGENCLLRSHSLLRHSLLLPDTVAGRGTVLDEVIACGEWAFKHKQATHKDVASRWINGLTTRHADHNADVLKRVS